MIDYYLINKNYYLYPLNFSETGWKDDYPNNFKSDDYHSGFNPNDIFKIKVKLNISDDIISKFDVRDKKILTVAASGDQAFQFYKNGAKISIL